jgi:hypothetical protein
MLELLATQVPLKAPGRLNHRHAVLFVKIPFLAATTVRLRRILDSMSWQADQMLVVRKASVTLADYGPERPRSTRAAAFTVE